MDKNVLNVLQDQDMKQIIFTFLGLSDSKQMDIIDVLSMMKYNNTEQYTALHSLGQPTPVTFAIPHQHVSLYDTIVNQKQIEQGRITATEFDAWRRDISPILLHQQGEEKLAILNPKEDLYFVKSYLDIIAIYVRIHKVFESEPTIFHESVIHFTINTHPFDNLLENLTKKAIDQLFKYTKPLVHTKFMQQLDIFPKESLAHQHDILEEFRHITKTALYHKQVENVLSDVVKKIVSKFDLNGNRAHGEEEPLFAHLQHIGTILSCFHELGDGVYTFGYPYVKELRFTEQSNKYYYVKVKESEDHSELSGII